MNGHPKGPDSGRRDHVAAGKLQGRYTVTAAIAVTCIALFFLRFLWGHGGQTEHLLRMGANHGTLVKGGDWYRLLASAFLHGDGLHLFANMLALASFGPVLEAMLGPRRYLVLYGASALVGSLASAFLTEPRPSVGASGAVWGLMTAGIAIVYRPQGLLPESLLAPARQRAWAPLAINLMYSFKPGVDFLAHIGGGVAGAALVLSGVITRGLSPLSSAPFSRRDRRGESPVWTALAVVVGLAMAGSVAAGFVVGKPWEAGKPPVLTRVVAGDTGVTLDLPHTVASQVTVHPNQGSTSFLYGDAMQAPMLFELIVSPLDAPVPPEALEAELENLRKTLEKPADATRTAEPQLRTIGPHRVVVDEIKHASGVPSKRYALVLGPRLVMLWSYERETRPKSWAGIEEKIVASVAEK